MDTAFRVDKKRVELRQQYVSQGFSTSDLDRYQNWLEQRLAEKEVAEVDCGVCKDAQVVALRQGNHSLSRKLDTTQGKLDAARFALLKVQNMVTLGQRDAALQAISQFFNGQVQAAKERQQYMLEMAVMFGLSLDEAAEIYNLGPEAAEQIKGLAMAGKLKTKAEIMDYYSRFK
jgi:hypothetical protein